MKYLLLQLGFVWLFVEPEDGPSIDGLSTSPKAPIGESISLTEFYFLQSDFYCRHLPVMQLSFSSVGQCFRVSMQLSRQTDHLFILCKFF